ncbi:hypothetical protein ARMGADRAFT_1083814 [Armillaria gallica]|uniref:Uncharacterized protein n=1 Tax=Armillaria gallica TaxID=47427 RepID=A0A2H3DM09_ARMGA|nr:hypothetical protein ARMGADRAFT_1083814 [Armillaria gallica]
MPSVCFSGFMVNLLYLIGLAVFAGDQIYSYGVRSIGTGVGLLNGLMAWYIGAARGNGNPYCLVIITTALTAPFILKGITCPSDKAFWSMIGVTTVFGEPRWLSSERTSFITKQRKTRLNGDLEKRHTNGSGDSSTKEECIRTFTPRMLAIAIRSHLSVHVLISKVGTPKVEGQWPYEQYTLLHSKL